VGAENETSSVRKKLFDSRKSRLNPGVIRDFEGIVGGNIKIGTHQDFLTGDVDITNGEFTHN
jgi:hypothetical protein